MFQEVVESLVKFFLPRLLRTDVEKKKKAVESGRPLRFISIQGLKDAFVGEIAGISRTGIIRMTQGTGRIVYQRESHSLCPGRNAVVVPFKRREQYRRSVPRKSKGFHRRFVPLQVGAEGVARDQQGIALRPVAVEEVIIAVRAEVMPILCQSADQGSESRVTVEAAGEEEGSGNMLLLEDTPDPFARIGVFITGEDEGQLFFRGVAADDGAAAQREAPLRGGAFFGLASASFAASR